MYAGKINSKITTTQLVWPKINKTCNQRKEMQINYAIKHASFCSRFLAFAFALLLFVALISISDRGKLSIGILGGNKVGQVVIV